MVSSRPGYGPMAGGCEQDNKASDSRNGMILLDESSGYYFRRRIPLQGIGYGVYSNVHRAG